MTGRIYKITNDLNDKVYVGQTIRTLPERFQKHCSKGDDLSNTMAIKNAIHKYGREHFKIELIEECDPSTLNDREIYWISYYDSYVSGYNCTRGGQKCGHSQKLTPAQETELINLYEAGHSSTELAGFFNVDKTTVLNYAKRHGLQIHNIAEQLEYKIDIESFKEYIRTEKPLIGDVVEKFGISRSSVYKLLKKLNDDTLQLNPYNPRKSNAKLYEQEVCDKYNEGYNIQDLCKIFHAQKKYVSKVLKEHGIHIQRGRKALL